MNPPYGSFLDAVVCTFPSPSMTELHKQLLADLITIFTQKNYRKKYVTLIGNPKYQDTYVVYLFPYFKTIFTVLKHHTNQKQIQK